MVIDSDLREVNFEKYCGICKYADCPEHEDPCFECLDNPLNYCTEKPVKWELEKEAQSLACQAGQFHIYYR